MNLMVACKVDSCLDKDNEDRQLFPEDEVSLLVIFAFVSFLLMQFFLCILKYALASRMVSLQCLPSMASIFIGFCTDTGKLSGRYQWKACHIRYSKATLFAPYIGYASSSTDDVQ